MPAAPIAICDALVVLANAEFTEAVECYRSYDATTELKDLTKGRIDFVSPTAWSKEYASRSQSQQTCDITAFVRKRFDRFEDCHAKTGDMDARLEFVDTFSDAAWAEPLPETVGANVTGVDIPTPFDWDSLKQNGLLLSVVTFSVRWFRTF